MTEEKKKKDYYPEVKDQTEEEKTLDAIAESIGVYDEGLGRRMVDLGYDKDTAFLIGFIPIIQVAWADGKVDARETKKLYELAESRGLEKGSKGEEFFKKLITEKPDDEFFTRSLKIINEIVAKLPEKTRKESLKDLSSYCIAIATASGGVMGFGKKISEEERKLMREMAEELGTGQSESAKKLLSQLVE